MFSIQSRDTEIEQHVYSNQSKNFKKLHPLDQSPKYKDPLKHFKAKLVASLYSLNTPLSKSRPGPTHFKYLRSAIPRGKQAPVARCFWVSIGLIPRLRFQYYSGGVLKGFTIQTKAAVTLPAEARAERCRGISGARDKQLFFGGVRRDSMNRSFLVPIRGLLFHIQNLSALLGGAAKRSLRRCDCRLSP